MEKYGFQYKAEEQKLKRNVYVAPPTLAKNQTSSNDYKIPGICALHHCTFSWFKQFIEKSGLGDKFAVIE